MKRNLLLVGYNFELVKKISAKLTEIFSLREYDVSEIFEFNIKPFSFNQVFELQGENYVDQKLTNIVRDGCEFSDILMIIEPVIVQKNAKLFDKIKANNVVLHMFSSEHNYVEKKSRTGFEANYYSLDSSKILQIEQDIKTKLCDIEIDVHGLELNEIVDKIIELMSEYCGM